ncbi:biotin transporter BioY [Oscillospiraceae bacterium MB08-C2-2]|nr:biotin transporter BioY [Oscillospiraceae bacterium MB08-C2-2]
MSKQKITTRDLCLIGIFTAFTCAMAQVTIPLPLIPMTMQTFCIPFVGIVLGSKRGAFSALVYALLGAVGLPVFAGFTGGLGIVFGPTGGFILSFPLMALLAGIGAEKGGKVWLWSGLVLGAVVNYLCGMFMFSAVTGLGLAAAFAKAVLPFLPTAAIKILLSGWLGVKCKTLLQKRVPA